MDQAIGKNKVKPSSMLYNFEPFELRYYMSYYHDICLATQIADALFNLIQSINPGYLI